MISRAPNQLLSKELIGAGICVGALVTLSALTICRWPLVWCDEPYFNDPAYNLAYHGRFTSETAYGGPADLAPLPGGLWTGNCPLYSILLTYWIRLFGFTLFSTRLLNLFLYTTAGLLVHAALRKRGYLATSASSILLPFLWFSAYGIVFLYRQSRYDVLCVLECAALFYVMTIDSNHLRRMLLMLIAVVVPWSGFPAVAWLASAYAAASGLCGRRIFVDGMWTGAGLAVGLAFLAYWLVANDSLQSFAAVVRSVHNRADYAFTTRMAMIFQGLFRDRAGMAVRIASGALLLARTCTRTLLRDSPVLLGSAVALSAAFVLNVVTTRVYDWMVTLPLIVGVVAELGGGKATPLPHLARSTAWGFSILAAMGLPGVLLATVYEWNERDHTRVETFVSSHITADDFCFCDITAYFPVRRIANRMMVDYGTWPTAGLWSDVESHARKGTPFTAMIVQADRAERIIAEFGSDWTAVASLPPATRTWAHNSPWRRLLLAAIDKVYPPPLSADRNQRISTDRMYELTVLRKTPNEDYARPVPK